MNKKILVEKADKTIEQFDSSKLRQSLLNSDASLVIANEVVEYIEEKIKDKMTTKEIYELAFEQLRSKTTVTAAKYSIRRSLLSLGPTGFPFEKFVSGIFQKIGYKTRTGIMMRGECIEHEVDVVALDENNLFICEIKFHNGLKIKTDTKVILYVKARYDDLKDKEYQFFNKILKPTKGLIITNTKFTNNAKKYAKCVGLELISWDYPKKGNLYHLIKETKMHPITALLSLSKNDKTILIKNNLIDSNELTKQKMLDLGFQDKKIDKIINEVNEICSK